MNKEVQEDRKYGILMIRQLLLAPSLYIFKPLSVVPGIIQSVEYATEDNESVINANVFVDPTGNSYNIAGNGPVLLTDEELYVSEIMDEKELMDKYGQDGDINLALDNFYSELSAIIRIGLYDEDNDSIYVLGLALDAIGESIVKQIEDGDSEEERLNQILEQTTGDNVIFMTVNKFKQLLEINDAQQLRSELQKIYGEIDEINKHFGISTEKIESIEKIEDIEDSQNENKILDVKAMKKFFDEHIIGQEAAKRDVIECVVMNSLAQDKHDRTACLLIGPTGSGKTLIAETLKEYLDVPMEIYDTTQLTSPGYKGGDIEDICTRLLAQTNGDLEKAEHGIVVFDEIDKKGSEDNGDISGRAVLNCLLSFIQGTTYDVTYNRKSYLFDTSNLTILATGACTNVAEANNEQNKTIGFNAPRDDNKEDIHYSKMTIQDLVKKGNMPIELLGRLRLTQLEGHTKESLTQILLSDNGPLIREKTKLGKIGVDLRWTRDFLGAVVNKAFELGTGARSLKQTIEQAVKEAKWEVLMNPGKYKSIILAAETVLDNNMCILVKKSGKKVNLNDIINKAEKAKVKVLGG